MLLWALPTFQKFVSEPNIVLFGYQEKRIHFSKCRLSLYAISYSLDISYSIDIDISYSIYIDISYGIDNDISSSIDIDISNSIGISYCIDISYSIDISYPIDISVTIDPCLQINGFIFFFELNTIDHFLQKNGIPFGSKTSGNS